MDITAESYMLVFTIHPGLSRLVYVSKVYAWLTNIAMRIKYPTKNVERCAAVNILVILV